MKRRPTPAKRALGALSALVLLAGCVVQTTPPPQEPAPIIAAPTTEAAIAEASERPLTPDEKEVMAGLQAAAVEVRRLPFLRPVVTTVRNATSITQALSEKMEDDDLLEAAEVYEALGLLPENTDVRELLEAVLGEQVVGYYDPDDEAMVIRDDVMASLAERGPAGSEEAGILVHELVHALQDQHYDLGAMYDEERSNDAGVALRSLVEGDATLAMVALGAQLGSQAPGGPAPDVKELARRFADRLPDLEEMMVDSAMPQGGMTLSQAPAIVRATLVVPYLAGLGFCAYWAKHGGWDAVDAHYERLPRSTEQVLHPEKSATSEEPVAIDLPALSGLGTEPAPEDTLGELELAVYLGQDRPSGVDASAAAGWAGDRLRIYRDGPMGAAVVWLTLWDDEDEAREAAAAARRVGSGVPGSHVHREGQAVIILRRVPARHRGATIRALSEAARRALEGGGGEAPSAS